MQWVSKIPSYGDGRKVRRFAVFPVQVGDMKVWLQYYTVHQYYSRYREWLDLYATL